jgi:hypothetical protein
MSDAIEAARIGAQDAIWAAWIQGGLTFAAGAVAIVGGAFAYRAAIKAARIQVKLEEDKHKALVSAYITRMAEIVRNLDDTAFVNSVHLKGDPDTVRVDTFAVPEELHPRNWRDHAMLGDKAVTAISDVYEMASIFDKFAREMGGKSAETNSEAFGAERAIDAYRQINQGLQDRAKKLTAILKSEWPGD